MGTLSRTVLLALATLAAGCTTPPVDDAGTPDDAEITDAGNLDAGPEGPILVVSPLSCDFGVVAIHAFESCDVTVANAGASDLAITVLGFTDATPVAQDVRGAYDSTLPGFGVETSAFLPLFVAPGTAVTLRLFAHPPALGATTGAFEIGHAGGLLTVPLKVTGENAALAVARIAMVNNAPWQEGMRIGPLDDVHLSAHASRASVGGTAITTWEWWILEKPETSGVELATPHAMSTRFVVASMGQTGNVIDVSGSYRVKLRVTDAAGFTHETELELLAVHDAELAIELTWASPSFDFDLHLIKDNGPWCSQNSCYYANCNTNAAFVTVPEWDGIPGETDGDPRLTIDDLSGYGPEQIEIPTVRDGVYQVGAAVYVATLNDPVVATMRIFWRGTLLMERTQALEGVKPFWKVAEFVAY
jgi:hypothetical protein